MAGTAGALTVTEMPATARIICGETVSATRGSTVRCAQRCRLLIRRKSSHWTQHTEAVFFVVGRSFEGTTETAHATIVTT